MCGILAVVRTATTGRPPDLDKLTDAVSHRGPDGRGVARFAPTANGSLEPVGPGDDWSVGLGHRRLSIVDLSDAGLQPMRYGHLWITYNGEVYNYVELRRELERAGCAFTSDSDTEVVLAAYATWGVEAFERFHGMWALIIIDTERAQVIACRDRLGIKPLYTARVGENQFFVSEPKQLRAFDRFSSRPDDAALMQYLASGYEEVDRTFFEGVQPFPAGYHQVIDLRNTHPVRPVSYWHPEGIVPDIDDIADATELFDEALRESTRLHLRADVPVGSALSGGLDSSAVTAYAARAAESPLAAFSVVFPGHSVDESRFAESVARHVGVEHRNVEPSVEDVLADFDHFVVTHDEPVATLSQYAAFALARLTRGASVPVLLNGQGGDEILGGYWQTYLAFLVGEARHAHVRSLLASVVGSARSGGNPELLRQFVPLGRRFVSRIRSSGSGLPLLDETGVSSSRARVRQALTLDAQARRVFEIREMYLPPLLRWDDRNLMAFSVEGRYPLLDHGLIESVLRMEPATMYRAGWVKEPLRRASASVLPDDVVRRRTKVGFETPQATWLCHGLRPEIEHWLRAPGPMWRYIDQAGTATLAKQVWAEDGRNPERSQALFRAFNADRWLRLCVGVSD